MRWYENSYRRGLVDMHIDDWDSKFFLFLILRNT